MWKSDDVVLFFFVFWALLTDFCCFKLPSNRPHPPEGRVFGPTQCWQTMRTDETVERPASEEEEFELDAFDSEEELEWSWKYWSICILLLWLIYLFVGQRNGYTINESP